MMNTDVITIYQKQNDNTWKRTVKDGVQWSDHIDKTTNSGRVSRKPYATITLFDGFEELGTLVDFGEEDFIVYGECESDPTTEKGNRPSDIVSANVKSGFISSVNDNSNRNMLKNIKVVISRG